MSGQGRDVDDATVVERLRHALDEVAASDRELVDERLGRRAGGPGDRGQRERVPGRARAWTAIAAVSLAMIAGSVLLLSRRDGPHDGTGDTTPGATVATSAPQPPEPPNSIPTAPTTAAPTVATPASTVDPSHADWYTVVSADLAPGPIVETVCCIERPCCLPAVAAWRIDGQDGALGVVLLEADPEAAVDGSAPVTTIGDEPDRVVRLGPDGATWTISGIGLRPDDLERLAALIVPGSGLPYVLPDPAASPIAFGEAGGSEATASGGARLGDGARLDQEYTGPSGSVRLSVGAYWGELGSAAGGAARRVVVAGRDAVVATGDAETVVLWSTGRGDTAMLRIPAAYADRVDGIIAAVVPVAAPPGR